MAWKIGSGEFLFSLTRRRPTYRRIRRHVADKYWPNREVGVEQLKQMYERIVAADREAAKAMSRG
jgi:DNA-binding GntR family transcriptional regulator